jgi:hypothetical protein
MFARSDIYFRLHLLLIIIHITCISLSLRRTSAPIHLTSVLGVLGTQETSCIVIAGLLERDTFDIFLPELDKPWVIHLRETCCYSINLCTWRPNTVYKNRSVRRHYTVTMFFLLIAAFFACFLIADYFSSSRRGSKRNQRREPLICIIDEHASWKIRGSRLNAR